MTADLQIVSDGAMLAGSVAGSGDPVIFLHANVADSRMWLLQMEAIAANNKAIAFDRRGFGGTRAEQEDYSALGDLTAVIDALADGKPAILVGCSQGGRIALDAALQHPSLVRGLVLIAPSVTGAPAPVFPPAIQGMMDQLQDAEALGDLDRVNALKARIFLDGPLAPEGRVTGEARRLFLEMHGHALRLPPVGSDKGAPPNFQCLDQIAAPSLVIWGDLDLPHVQDRSRHVATMMPNAAQQVLSGAAHLPSLERPDDITGLLVDFIGRCA